MGTKLSQMTNDLQKSFMFEINKQKLICASSSKVSKKYFLLCNNCYWMMSTISDLSKHHINFKNCPICENMVTQFQIPSKY